MKPCNLVADDRNDQHGLDRDQHIGATPLHSVAFMIQGRHQSAEVVGAGVILADPITNPEGHS
jgi:hypothetical protein